MEHKKNTSEKIRFLIPKEEPPPMPMSMFQYILLSFLLLLCVHSLPRVKASCEIHTDKTSCIGGACAWCANSTRCSSYEDYYSLCPSGYEYSSCIDNEWKFAGLDIWEWTAISFFVLMMTFVAISCVFIIVYDLRGEKEVQMI